MESLEPGMVVKFGNQFYSLLYREMGEGKNELWMACERDNPASEPRLIPVIGLSVYWPTESTEPSPQAR